MSLSFLTFAALLNSQPVNAGELENEYTNRQLRSQSKTLNDRRTQSLHLAEQIAERLAKSRVLNAEIKSVMGDLTYIFKMENGMYCSVGFSYNDGYGVSCY